MESATGGAIANSLSDHDGSSEYFKGSLVAYTAEAKIDLGVPAEEITMHGVISREVAEAMAKVAREKLHADLAIGITGIAGGEEVEGQPPGTHAHRALRRRSSNPPAAQPLLPGARRGEAPCGAAGAHAAAQLPDGARQGCSEVALPTTLDARARRPA